MTDGNTYALQEVTAELEQAEARIEELEANLAKAVDVAETLSGCVEYDYHGNVMGQENAKAIATLAELSSTMKGQEDE